MATVWTSCGAELVRGGWCAGRDLGSVTYIRRTAGGRRGVRTRPSRWRSAATLSGAPIWATESTEPMSMPISRVEVQTAVVGRGRGP